jgi:uncharacterized protein YkwD
MTHRRNPPGAVLTGAEVATRARASTIAKVLATQCQNTALMPEPGNLGLIKSAILCLINRERASNGETPLALSRQLEGAAEVHGREMVSEDYFEHISPSGRTPVDRIRSAGYLPSPADGYVIGENLAWGTLNLATPQAIAEAWIASPKHLENILEARYRETGIGVVPAVPVVLAQGQLGATYVQEFGAVIR